METASWFFYIYTWYGYFIIDKPSWSLWKMDLLVTTGNAATGVARDSIFFFFFVLIHLKDRALNILKSPWISMHIQVSMSYWN